MQRVHIFSPGAFGCSGADPYLAIGLSDMMFTAAEFL